MDQQFQPAPPPPAPAGDKKGLAIAGFVIGIVDLCAWLLPICGGPIGIVGLILSILGLKSPSTLAIIGIVLSAVGLILVIINMIAGIALLGSNGIFNQIISNIGY